MICLVLFLWRVKMDEYIKKRIPYYERLWFYRFLFKSFEDPKWCEKVGISNYKGEAKFKAAEEILCNTLYPVFFETPLEMPKEAESISLDSLPVLSSPTEKELSLWKRKINLKSKSQEISL
jgi:hypothetical protein